MEGEVRRDERKRRSSSTRTRRGESASQTHCGGSGSRHPCAEGRGQPKVVKPSARRDVVRFLQQVHGMSERRSCRLVRVWQATHRYARKRGRDESLRSRFCELAAECPRYGYSRLYRKLTARRDKGESQTCLPALSRRRADGSEAAAETAGTGSDLDERADGTEREVVDPFR